MEEILHQLGLGVFPIIYNVFDIPDGAGFFPSPVSKAVTGGQILFQQYPFSHNHGSVENYPK